MSSTIAPHTETKTEFSAKFPFAAMNRLFHDASETWNGFPRVIETEEGVEAHWKNAGKHVALVIEPFRLSDSFIVIYDIAADSHETIDIDLAKPASWEKAAEHIIAAS